MHFSKVAATPRNNLDSNDDFSNFHKRRVFLKRSKRNAARLQEIHRNTMFWRSSFQKKNFKDQCSFQLKRASWKGYVFLKRNAPIPPGISKICNEKNSQKGCCNCSRNIIDSHEKVSAQKCIHFFRIILSLKYWRRLKIKETTSAWQKNSRCLVSRQ